MTVAGAHALISGTAVAAIAAGLNLNGLKGTEFFVAAMIGAAGYTAVDMGIRLFLRHDRFLPISIFAPFTRKSIVPEPPSNMYPESSYCFYKACEKTLKVLSPCQKKYHYKIDQTAQFFPLRIKTKPFERSGLLLMLY